MNIIVVRVSWVWLALLLWPAAGCGRIGFDDELDVTIDGPLTGQLLERGERRSAR